MRTSRTPVRIWTFMAMSRCFSASATMSSSEPMAISSTGSETAGAATEGSAEWASRIDGCPPPCTAAHGIRRSPTDGPSLRRRMIRHRIAGHRLQRIRRRILKAP
jgi:hypothetical protein